MKNDLTSVKRLVKGGSHSIREKDASGWTPLMLAIQHSLYDMVEYLVDEAGARMDGTCTNSSINMILTATSSSSS
eukprot:CAMPEP_0205877658 /NCGR_PEP_ID=MMETSP1083-20121108/14437_1 /ASSEMBLY_ACC=CAM_ASM_000430 /TAXON_ID=97485 /ORGANISM="Prymnesium parvum, Strain Texoma1" /LENGTH=74 /DNA_ID=CAMNT_0053240477 /DNA_START=69 /DNA_END=293 /DNA_ORIENTATION=-